jgi:hypothetical protein
VAASEAQPYRVDEGLGVLAETLADRTRELGRRASARDDDVAADALPERVGRIEATMRPRSMMSRRSQRSASS